jgi:hypothetical protein
MEFVVSFANAIAPWLSQLIIRVGLSPESPLAPPPTFYETLQSQRLLGRVRLFRLCTLQCNNVLFLGTPGDCSAAEMERVSIAKALN